MRPPLGARLCRTSSRLPRSAAGGSPQFCSYDVEQPRCCISCHKHRRACLLLLQLRRVPQTACLCHTSCICKPTCMLYRKLQMILLDIFFRTPLAILVCAPRKTSNYSPAAVLLPQVWTAVLARCLLHVVYEFQAFLNLFAKQALGLSSGMAAQVTYPSPNHFQCIRACCTTARSLSAHRRSSVAVASASSYQQAAVASEVRSQRTDAANNAARQVAAGFSAGSAVAVLAGGFLFCRLQGAGRRNLTFVLCAMTAGKFHPFSI